jgi:hypothetical protein
MNNSYRSIFRAEALRRYAQGRERAILPPIVSPRTFIVLWALLGFLISGVMLAWNTRVPMYASGQAFFVRRPAGLAAADDAVVLVALLPPSHQAMLQVGQPLFLDLGLPNQRLRLPIIAIEHPISSPATIQQRFAIPPSAAAAITQPSAVAIARIEPFPTDLAPAAYLGSHYPVDIEIGSQCVLAFVPLIGHLFKQPL